MALFISEEYLKANSIINDNADMKVLTPVIEIVQDIHIKNIIGSGLFDEINSQIDSSTVSVLNTTLLNNYILKCMVWYILAEAPPVFIYRFENKGIEKKNSENSNSASLDEIQWLISRYQGKAEHYREALRRYLLANPTDYPLYLNPGSEVDTVHPKRNSYHTGIYLGEGKCYEKKTFEERYQGNNGCLDE